MNYSRPALALTALMLSAAPALAEVKVAVANPIKILNELAETKDINKTMEGETATFRAQANDRSQKLNELKAQRDQLKTDSPQYADLDKQLTEQQATAQAWAQSSQQQLQRKFREQAKRMHAKITAAVAEVAKAEKIDVILADQKPEIPEAQVEKMEPQQLLGVLFGRNLLYSSDALDITQKVIAKLDAAYKAK